ncbi:MAG: hypothetical protein PVF43_13480 [Candidatus Eiseniibacteriota bacterium]|jgi:hypothetical protein
MRTYTIIGGGCFGSFYVRQLRRWAKRQHGPVGRIVVVDRDPECRVACEAREAPDPRLELRIGDWVEVLCELVPRLASARSPVTDRLVPSCHAPHVLLQSLSRLTGREPIGAEVGRELFAGLSTPFVHDLENGCYAVSYATWTCPVNCIEPETCPAIRQPLDWDVGTALRAYAAERADRIDACHILSCQHEAFGVGTIPLAAIVDAYRVLRDGPTGAGTTHDDGARRGRVSAVATVSTCHGVIGALQP